VVGAQHGGASGDAAAGIRARYGQLALDHRISLHSVWDDANRDWNHFDTYYGPLLDGTAPTRLKGAKLTSVSSGANLTSAAEHGDWAAHFRSRGWFDRLFQYTCDEPPITCSWTDIPLRAGAAKAGDPEFRTLVTTNMSHASGNGVAAAIDVIVPLVNEMDDRGLDNYGWTQGGDTRPQYDSFLAGGKAKELWIYESCMSDGCGGTVDIGNPSADQLYFTGWPSYMVDASSTRARALEWFSFRWGATGELYYETVMAYYERDPWTGGVWDFNGNGDGTLFYPGTVGHIGGQTDIPVASIRLKMIREGMEDYEYMKLLSDLGDGESARRVAMELFPHPYQADAKPADLMAARESLARRILALQHKPVPPPTSVEGDFATASAKYAFLVQGSGGGCGVGGAGQAGGLLSMALLPLALVLARLRRRGARSLR
jgi:hypothetical protein